MTTDSKAVCGGGEALMFENAGVPDLPTTIATEVLNLPWSREGLPHDDPTDALCERHGEVQGIVSAALASTAGAGAGDWVTVPRRPFPEMLGAFWRIKNTGSTEPGEFGDDRSDVAAYRAMIEAAPAVPASPTSGAVEAAFREGWRVNAVPACGAQDAEVGLSCHPEAYLQGCEDADWKASAAHAALITAPAVPASPIKGGGTPTWPASYQETFDAIAAAVTVHDGTTFGISVKAFYRALAYPETAAPPAPAEHGVEIREAAQAVLTWFEQQAGMYDLCLEMGRLRAALSQEGGAGRSEKGEGETLERVRHVKRGTEYEVLGEAEAQVSYDLIGAAHRVGRPLWDENRLTVYRCLKTGKLWCRFTDEFRDGRFVPVATAQSPSTSDAED